VNPRVKNTLLVLAIGLAVGAVAYVLSAGQPTQYDSVARLYFAKGAPPALQVLGPQFGQPDVKEEIALATAVIDLKSTDIAVTTAKDNPTLHMPPGEIAANVQPQPVPGTLVVEVRARAANGFVAAALAKDYVNAYFKLKHQADARRARSVQAVVKRRLKTLPSSQRSKATVQLLRDQITALDTLASVGTAGPQVIEAPQPSFSPATPKPNRDALFGALFGLAVGGGLVALRSGRRDRGAIAHARETGTVVRAEPAPRR
jgi:uncharacterized protein involved in exopolysaccharide biosynthesis